MPTTAHPALGVWLVFYHDYGPQAKAVFPDELEARRWADENGEWYNVAFWRFGTELTQATK